MTNRIEVFAFDRGSIDSILIDDRWTCNILFRTFSGSEEVGLCYRLSNCHKYYGYVPDTDECDTSCSDNDGRFKAILISKLNYKIPKTLKRIGGAPRPFDRRTTSRRRRNDISLRRRIAD